MILFDPAIEILGSDSSVLLEQPERRRILLTSLIPAQLAPLLSVTIRSGIPLDASVFARKCLGRKAPAGVFREKMMVEMQ